MLPLRNLYACVLSACALLSHGVSREQVKAIALGWDGGGRDEGTGAALLELRAVPKTGTLAMLEEKTKKWDAEMRRIAPSDRAMAMKFQNCIKDFDTWETDIWQKEHELLKFMNIKGVLVQLMTGEDSETSNGRIQLRVNDIENSIALSKGDLLKMIGRVVETECN
ncbi:unnamed protein product [Amoebophrya sp. A25]|nr:unnamed protein product [Amoebophrya sp. A25]|eukprot:GSA25T00020708001.1